MQVSKIMNSNVVYLSPDDTAASAAKLLMRHNIGALPICSRDGRLRGLVTDRDITLRCIALDNPPEETKLREIMTRGVVCISPHEEISDAIQLISSEQIFRLPVVENGRIVGMLSLSDLLLRGNCKNEISEALCEIYLHDRRFNKK
ncbi:MAG: CBS domain-containing protein [Oscillospiraceae bacterium]|nr:CBS domain-containing protein [Oscillospiraceae bacterium]